nr:DUF5300 family protein [uncultured Blautia sp.]
MKKFLRNILIGVLVVGVVAGLAAFKVDDNKTYAEQLMAQDMVTIKNTTLFELQNLTIQYNNEKETTVNVINPGESVKVEVLEDAKPVISVKITGSTKGGMKLSGFFTGLINNETYFSVYLDEDMTLGVNSNIVNE